MGSLASSLTHCLILALRATSCSFAHLALSSALVIPERAMPQVYYVMSRDNYQSLLHSLRVGKTNPGMEYQIKVQDEQGKPVTQTPLYKEVQNPGYVFRSTSLEINSPAKRRSILHVFFELGMPGKYSIEVQRLLPRQLGPDIVKSNAIMLTIIPR